MMMVANLYSLYETTLPLVGMENLVMGITLSILCLAKKYGRVHNKSGLIFLAIAMLTLSLINLTEYFVGGYDDMISVSLAVVVFAASVEMFLFFFAYVSMLDKNFASRKRIITELALIVLFTSPALFISQKEGLLFEILFSVSIAFYAVKLICNFVVYRRTLRKAVVEIENFHSEESSSLLAWITRTFYVTMAIGTVSLFAPFGNFGVLTVYNLFMLVAYLYIYVEVIRNIYTFDGSMAAMDEPAADEATSDCKREKQEKQCVEENAAQQDDHTETEDMRGFMTPFRQKRYQEWIERRGYADPGITAQGIALMFNSNRTSLSQYLNNELGMTCFAWITRLRMEDAKKQLIEKPDASISEIAMSIGIADQSNFGRAFKRFTGVSPAAYRRNNIR